MVFNGGLAMHAPAGTPETGGRMVAGVNCGDPGRGRPGWVSGLVERPGGSGQVRSVSHWGVGIAKAFLPSLLLFAVWLAGRFQAGGSARAYFQGCLPGIGGEVCVCWWRAVGPVMESSRGYWRVLRSVSVSCVARWIMDSVDSLLLWDFSFLRGGDGGWALGA